VWFRRYAEAHGFPAAVEWRDSGRPLPELAPGDRGDAFMAPAAAPDARSTWSRDVTGKRSATKRRR
jgi:enoyl-CoA hydratase